MIKRMSWIKLIFQIIALFNSQNRTFKLEIIYIMIIKDTISKTIQILMKMMTKVIRKKRKFKITYLL